MKSSLTHQFMVCGDDEVKSRDVNLNTIRNELLVHVRAEVDQRKRRTLSMCPHLVSRVENKVLTQDNNKSKWPKISGI